jgi:preprotein translocase subunit SecF
MTDPTAPARSSIWSRLYRGETTYDFVGNFGRWVAISCGVIVVGMISLASQGLNLGIDFEGGVVWEVPQGDASVVDAQATVEDLGVDGVTVQTLTAEGVTRLRVEGSSLPLAEANEVSDALAELTGSEIEAVNLTSVGPSWGREISEKAIRALVLFLIVLTIYISFRFELKMAIPTVIALVHDVLITLGVYSLAGFEVTPATVVSLLTILGFSIYDGIVVFDKVDENTPLVSTANDMTYREMVNLSLNQVLMRSLNTSITAILPVGALLVLGSFVLGATTLEEFALALLIGLFAGAYSSIFIASPMLALLKEREPRYRDIRDRLASRRGAPPTGAPPVAVAEPTREDAEPAPADAVPALSGRAIPPRPRKKGKKR